MSVAIEFAAGIRAAIAARGVSHREITNATDLPTFRVRSFADGVAIPQPDEFGALWHFLTTDPPARPGPAA
jgi:hypothetical protein